MSTLVTKVCGGLVGLEDGGSRAEDSAVGGVNDGVDEVFAEEARGDPVHSGSLIDQVVNFHNSVAHHVVEYQGH